MAEYTEFSPIASPKTNTSQKANHFSMALKKIESINSEVE